MDPQISKIEENFDENFILLSELFMKGDDVQKLSVIQSIPQLIQFNESAVYTRIIPKIQQELPASSCEFHLAASKAFRSLMEKKTPLNLLPSVIQGVDSKDPVVANAWLETLFIGIPQLTESQVKNEVLKLAVAKAQSDKTTPSKVAACHLLGKISSHPKIDANDVKSTILPLSQGLCQDPAFEVRGTICAQLSSIAQGLKDSTLVKSSLLPNLVELSKDENNMVRSAAVMSIVLTLPYTTAEMKTDVIIPLMKQLCERSLDGKDLTATVIAKDYGKFIDGVQANASVADAEYFLKYYRNIASKGQGASKGKADVNQGVVCRQFCAYNLPALTIFTCTKIAKELESTWYSIYKDLAGDPCYIVRKTVAGCVHEIVKILAANCKLIKPDIVRLLRDDAEEVLHMLVPNLGITLEVLCTNGLLSRETTSQTTLEIGRAILKCQIELTKGYNWRMQKDLLEQLEHLPNCVPSDFIHQHFTPVLFALACEPKAKPVRIQAARTLLVFLRYNIKEIQRKWIKDNLTTRLCMSKSCIIRQIYVGMCHEAVDVFSHKYFKELFFSSLLDLAEDPVLTVRYSVVKLIPKLKIMLAPDDKALNSKFESMVNRLQANEKDKDLVNLLKCVFKQMRSNQDSAMKAEALGNEKFKQEEEAKVAQGKYVVNTKLLMAAVSTGAAPAGGQGGMGAAPAKSPSSIGKSPSALAPQNKMCFLEKHFYVDAGVPLPVDNILQKRSSSRFESATLMNYFEDVGNKHSDIEDEYVSTVSAENVNLDQMTANDFKLLETTSNITDDVKVNLRKAKKNDCVLTETTNFNIVRRKKRYSNIYPVTTEINKSSQRRRSLNISSSDSNISRIPISSRWFKTSISKSVSDLQEDFKSLNNQRCYPNIGKKTNFYQVTGQKTEESNNNFTVEMNSKDSASSCTKNYNYCYAAGDAQPSTYFKQKDNKIASSKLNNKSITTISNLPVLKKRTSIPTVGGGGVKK